MDTVTQSLLMLLPEALLATGVLMLVLADLLQKKEAPRQRGIAATIALGSLAAAGLSVWGISGTGDPVFHGMVIVDPFALYFKMLFVAAAVLVVVLARRSHEVEETRTCEFYALVLSLTLGMCLLVGAANALMVFLSMEFVAISSYVLTAFRRGNKRSAEAAMKYVLYGSMTSAVLLFGFSYLYGLTGSLDLQAFGALLPELLQGGAAQRLVASLAVIMVVAGFCFKIAAVPLHMWCPDVYEGAPTPVTAMLSVGPKAAGFAVLIRFFGLALGFEALPWAALLGGIAALTMTVGNLGAIGQGNVKRLLAYSSIAHAGYMLAAVACGTTEGVNAVMFYFGVYLCMNFGAFLVVIAVRDATGGSEDIDAYRGLSQRNPLLAAIMTVFLLSLVGLPPLGGFIGKFYIFAALVKKAGFWYYGLAILGVLNSAVSLYYYARILKAMFLSDPDTGVDKRLSVPPSYTIAAVVLACAVLAIGVYWRPLQSLVAHCGLL